MMDALEITEVFCYYRKDVNERGPLTMKHKRQSNIRLNARVTGLFLASDFI